MLLRNALGISCGQSSAHCCWLHCFKNLASDTASVQYSKDVIVDMLPSCMLQALLG